MVSDGHRGWEETASSALQCVRPPDMCASLVGSNPRQLKSQMGELPRDGPHGLCVNLLSILKLIWLMPFTLSYVYS